MKRLLSVLTAALLALALASCGASPSPAPADSGALPEALEIVNGAWPDNDFTAAVPRPETGVLESGWLAEGAYCALTLTGVDDDAFAGYLTLLEDAGFSQAAYNSEALAMGVSAGTLYTGGNVGVSLAHQGDTLALSISFLT